MATQGQTIEEYLARWDFKRDPFGESYPYQEGFWAGPEEQVSYLKFLLSNKAKTEGSVLNIFLQGEYGTGKTYTLRSLQSYVESSLGGLAIYFQIPSKQDLKGFRDVYREIIAGVGLNTIRDVGKIILDTNKLATKEDFLKFLEQTVQTDDFRQALANLVFDQDFALTWSWLLGEATIHQQRSLGFLSSTKDEGLELNIIVELLDYLVPSKKFVAVLIDELENLVGVSRTVKSIREGFRNLYDKLTYGPRKGSVAIITSATIRYVFEIREFLGTPLDDRIDERLAIEPLKESEVISFVQELFQWARDSQDKSLTPKPFKDEEAVNAFVAAAKSEVQAGEETAKGLFTRRKVIKAGKQLFWRAAFHGVSQIDASFVNRALPASVTIS